MVSSCDEVGLWYDLDQDEFESYVRHFLVNNCGWNPDDVVPDVIYQAFITKSFGNRDNGILNNEPLFFYGSTVIENIVAGLLLAEGKYPPSIMSEAKNYVTGTKSYAYVLLNEGVDLRPLLRINLNKDKTSRDNKVIFVHARVDEAVEAFVGALDLIGRRDLASSFVSRYLLGDVFELCDRMSGLGDADMRKKWKKVNFQRAEKIKDYFDRLGLQS